VFLVFVAPAQARLSSATTSWGTNRDRKIIGLVAACAAAWLVGNGVVLGRVATIFVEHGFASSC
jgi:hypothetical protein